MLCRKGRGGFRKGIYNHIRYYATALIVASYYDATDATIY